VKKRPNDTVKQRATKEEKGSPVFKEACDQVTVAPEERRTTVFSRGT